MGTSGDWRRLRVSRVRQCSECVFVEFMYVPYSIV